MNARLNVWSLRPQEGPVEDLRRLAELHSGYTIDAEGEDRRFGLAEYQQLWQSLCDAHPAYFANASAAPPAELPAVPPGAQGASIRPVARLCAVCLRSAA